MHNLSQFSFVVGFLSHVVVLLSQWSCHFVPPQLYFCPTILYTIHILISFY